MTNTAVLANTDLGATFVSDAVLARIDYGHRFFYSGDPDDAEVRCDGCDCRPGGRWARIPCTTFDRADHATVTRACWISSAKQSREAVVA